MNRIVGIKDIYNECVLTVFLHTVSSQPTRAIFYAISKQGCSCLCFFSNFTLLSKRTKQNVQFGRQEVLPFLRA